MMLSVIVFPFAAFFRITLSSFGEVFGVRMILPIFGIRPPIVVDLAKDGVKVA